MALNNTGFDAEKSMDTVFKLDGEAQIDFDTMFDQEDDMIDTIAGLKEDGTPVTGDINYEAAFDDLHQEDRENTVNDFKKAITQPGDLQGAKHVNGTDKLVPDTDSNGQSGTSDFDKFIVDAEDNYQKGDADKGSGVATDGAVVTKSMNSQIKESYEDADEFFGEDSSEDAQGNDIDIPDADKELDEQEQEIDPDTELDRVAMGEEGELLDYTSKPNIDDKERSGDAKSVMGGDDSYEKGKSCSCGKASCPICGKNNDDAIRNGAKPTPGIMEGLDADSFLDDADDSDYRDGKKLDSGVEEEYDIDADLDESGCGCGKSGKGSGITDIDEELDIQTEDEATNELASMSEGVADSDVEDVVDAEFDDEDDLIDLAANESGGSTPDLKYDYEDDELIDMVAGE